MNKDKEDALKDYLEMIERSWTWYKLTENEKMTFKRWLYTDRYQLKGSYKQRWDILQNYYMMFLLGTGYEDHNWRETEQEKKENPRF